MIVTVNWIKEHYIEFNNKYWNGELPTIEFKVNHNKRMWGYASFIYDYPNNKVNPEYIAISNYFDSPEEVKMSTLLHEMIHIADYTFNPEHFVQNHKPVSGHKYNAHGFWFMKECRRINAYGIHKVDNHVTKEEENVSKLSVRSEKCLERKKDVALICVLRGTTGMNFYFKTDIYKAKMIPSTVKRYNFYYIGEVKKIEFYTFEDDKLAAMRSCGKRLSGWHLNNEKMLKKLESIKATTVKL